MPVNFSEEQLKDINPNQGKESPETKESLFEKLNNFVLKLSRIPLKERLFFVQHLNVMLRAGISLSKGLDTLSLQTSNKYFAKILSDVSKKVDGGESFGEALKPYENIFGEMFVSMVEASEVSGKLEEVLEQLFIQMKKEHKLFSKIKGALTYPAVIIMAMMGIGTFMFVFVIPKITDMFATFDAELPLPTKILIKTSNIIAANGLISLLVFILVVTLFVKTIKTKKGKYYFQAILLNFPIISPIIKKINLARFSRNISSLLKTDIMIIKTFEITAKVLGNLHYRKALEEMAQKIKKGGKISDVIKEYPKLFTPVVAQMVSIGEETGELDNILLELAEFYEEEVDQIMENLPSIIEPLLILVLGVGVGGVAVAIIMPMYSLTSAI